MDLYIEKEFLDNFYLDYNEDNPRNEQSILASILREYGDLKVYIDIEIESVEHLERLKSENRFFADIIQHVPPLSVSSIKDHFFQNTFHSQALIFTDNEKEWFNEAQDRGALCFSFNDFEGKILKIIEKCHYRLDLSQEIKNWQFFSNMASLPIKKILINDGYILTDKSNQKMRENVIPMLEELVGYNYNSAIPVHIFTSDLNPPKPGNNQQIKTVALQKIQRINSFFGRYNLNFRIIANDLKKSNFDFHDRIIMSDYFIIDSAKGFNLFPYKKSNSQIISETIFNKYTYRRIKNLTKMHEDYMSKIDKIETLGFKIV